MRVKYRAAVAVAFAVSAAMTTEPLPWEWFDATDDGDKAIDNMRRVNGERAVAKRSKNGGL